MASLSDEQLWEYVRRCDVPTLKTLLAKVGVPNNANKPFLQQRVFYAVRLGLDLLPTQEDKDRQVAVAHRVKLDLGSGFCLPHPLTLDDWEYTSANYPDIQKHDVELYFDKCNREAGIGTGGQKALSEGFSLFTSNHVQSVAYHKIVDMLGIGFIRGYVIPTMRVRADMYLVWVQVYKSTGAVRIGDCHCIAGVSSMCKHVAALLYFVTNEVSKGENDACTSVRQVWHKPAQNALKTSAMISDVKTPKASSRVCPQDKPQRSKFDPRPVPLRRERSLSDFDLDTLSELSDGKAAVLLYSKRFRQVPDIGNDVPDITHVADSIEVETVHNVPAIIPSFAQHKVLTADSFMQRIGFNALGRDDLEKTTRSQTESEVWQEQRKGRITASVMHSVVSHVTGDDVCGQLSTVVETIMGYNQAFQSTSTSHGKKGESVVRKRYARQEKKVHKGLAVQPSGLWVLEKFPLVAATPDGIVQCECCPQRLLEIKCPYACRHLTIQEYALQGTSNTSAKHKTVIIMKDNKITINMDHHYYTQVQTQLLCTGLSSCDLAIGTEATIDNFAVFSIQRNDIFCDMLLRKAEVFYHKVIFPELQTKNFYMNKQSKLEKKALTVINK